MLGKRHRAGIKPAVYNLGNAVHLLAAMGAFNSNRVDIRAVQLNIVRTVIRKLLELGYTADRMQMSAFALPDIKRSSPVAVTGNSPILNVFEPVAETSLAYAFGYPVYSIVIADKVVLNSRHLNEPGFTRIVDKRSIAAPAMGIFMLKLRSVEQKPLFVKVAQNKRICVLNKFSGIRRFLCHIALAVNQLNKRQVIAASYAGVVLTERRGAVNNTGTVSHSNIAVAHNKECPFILLLANRLCAVEQRLVFLIFKLFSGKSSGYLISGSVIVSKTAENLIEQSLSHIVGITVRSLNAAIDFIRIDAESNVGRQRPGRCRPGKEISVLIGYFKAHDC